MRRRETILSVTFEPKPKYIDRSVACEDFNTVIEDKEGERVTLASDKRRYPYELVSDTKCRIETSKRVMEVEIPKGYVWNGADIPSILWVFVGSKDDPSFKIPSLIHDYLLEYKDIADKYNIPLKEYRRLTSLIFRQCLKNYGTRTIKSNIMSFAVQLYQSTVNRKAWREEYEQ